MLNHWVMIFLQGYLPTLQPFILVKRPLKIREPSALWETNKEEYIRKMLLPIPLW